MKDLGQHTIGPNTETLDVGPVTFEENEQTLWVEVKQVAPVEPWPFSFGLLYFESSDGRTLGTVKAYGHRSGETYRLGIGRPPLVRTGRLKFQSRHYNLGWVKAKNPQTWTLAFSVETGSDSSGGDVPIFGTRSTLGVFTDLAGSVINYAITDGVARILLPTP
jgi:hypothetical protein